MTSVNRAGIFSRIAAYGALAAAGIAGGVDINNSHTQEKDTITAGQRLDERFVNDRRFNSQSRQIREQELAVAELRNGLNVAQGQIQEASNKTASLEQQNSDLQRDLTMTNASLSQARTESGVISTNLEQAQLDISGVKGDVANTAITLTEYEQKVDGLSKALTKKTGNSEVIAAIKKAKPSIVMISDRTGKGAGFILDVEGKKYLLSAAHLSSLHEFVLDPITVTTSSGDSVEFIPPPFDGDKVAYFPELDFFIFPCPKELLDVLPDNVGLSFRDFVKSPLEEGEQIFNGGNPNGLGFSFTTREIVNPGRKVEEKPDTKDTIFVQSFPGFNPGESGSAALDLNAKVIGIVCFTYSGRTFVPHAFLVKGDQIKKVLEQRCGLSVMSEAEKLQASASESLGFDLPPGVRVVAAVNKEPKKAEPLLSYDTVRNKAVAERVKKWEPVILLVGKLYDARPRLPLTIPPLNDLLKSINLNPALPVPPLPEPAVPIAPGPESLTPERDPKFSKPYDTAPAPGDEPMQKSVIPDSKKPAPPVPIE